MSPGLFLDNKKYISAKEASNITGYSKDYVGQLARSKKIGSRRVGRIWYIEEESILNYKNFGNESGLINEERNPDVKVGEPTRNVGFKNSELRLDTIKKLRQTSAQETTLSNINKFFLAVFSVGVALVVVTTSLGLDNVSALVGKISSIPNKILTAQVATLADEPNVSSSDLSGAFKNYITVPASTTSPISSASLTKAFDDYTDETSTAIFPPKVPSSGPTGILGARGPQGIQGSRGPQGLQGPQGIQGPPGASIDISEFVTIASFDNQVDRIYDSMESSVQSLSNSLGDSINTGTLSVSADATFGEDIIVAGIGTFTRAPTLPHTFAPSWPDGTSNVSDATLYINPASAVADSNLIGLAVNGTVKFLVDAEGDIYGNNLILTGSTTTGATTIAGSLTVQDNTTLGDAPTDLLTINGTAVTIPNNLNFDANTLFIDAANDRVGIGTTAPTQLLSLGATDSRIGTDTLDGSDNKRLQISGAAASVTRGAYINLNGNEFATEAGYMKLLAGYDGAITFSAQANLDAVTERMRITAAGNVGIGTTGPVRDLDVLKTSAGADVSVRARNLDNTNPLSRAVLTASVGGASAGDAQVDFSVTGATSWAAGIDNSDSDSFKISSSADLGTNDRLTITTTGNVGIGTTGPDMKLTVSGDANISNGNGLVIGHTAQVTISEVAPELQVLGTAEADSTLAIMSYNTGATNPAQLILGFSKNATIGTNTTRPSSGDHIGRIGFAASDDTNILEHASIDAYADDGWSSGSDTPTRLTFSATPNGSNVLTEYMRITNGGNVGIGTTGPGSVLQLHLAATVNTPILRYSDADLNHGLTTLVPTTVSFEAGQWGSTTGGAYLRGFSTGTVGTPGIALHGFLGSTDPDDSIPAVRIIGSKKTGTDQVALGAAETVLEIQNGPSGTKLMTFLGSGNVGIGTTVPVNKLSVYAGASSATVANFVAGATPFVNIGDNVDPTTAGSKRLQIGVDTSSNFVRFDGLVQGSGTLPIVFNPTGGNVGIGTTAPDLKLQVGAVVAADPASSGTTQTGGFSIRGAAPVQNTVMNFGIVSASPFGGWIQVQDASDLSIEYPLRLNPNGGNVGIGTTVPIDVTHIYSTGTASKLGMLTIQNEGGGNPGDIAGISFIAGGNATAGPKGAIGYERTNSNNRGDITFYQNSTNDSSAVTSAGEVMRITNTGNVGIGTTGPLAKLHVADGAIAVNSGSAFTSFISGEAYGAMYTTTSGGAGYPFNGSGHLVIQPRNDLTRDIIFATRDSAVEARMVILSGGNVGIGTTAPRNKLHISGDLVHDPGTTGYGQLMVGGTNLDKAVAIGFDTTGNYGFIYAREQGVSVRDLALQTGGGNVGIGTTAPGAQLYIGDGTGTAAKSIQIDSAGLGVGVFGINNSAGTGLISTGGLAYATVVGSSNATALQFFTSDTVRATIDADGNVGIGTTGPADILHLTTGNLRIGASTAVRATTPGTNQLILFDGTAPVGTLVNGISMYSTAGEAYIMDAAGNETLQSPHENTNNYWVFDSKNSYTGKSLLVDMELMMKQLNAAFGWDFVHETIDGVASGPATLIANTFDLRIDGIEERVAALEANALTPLLGEEGVGGGLSSFGQIAIDFFADGIQSVVDGIVYMKGLVVETLTVGSPDKRTGITLYDEVTGDPYCLSIANGENKTTEGECVVTEASTGSSGSGSSGSSGDDEEAAPQTGQEGGGEESESNEEESGTEENNEENEGTGEGSGESEEETPTEEGTEGEGESETPPTEEVPEETPPDEEEPSAEQPPEETPPEEPEP